jgi:hypothetical protein
MCDLLGIDHGVNFPKLIEVGDYISRELSRDNLARVAMADLDLLESRRKELFE